MPTRLLLGILLFLSSAGTLQKYAGTVAAIASLPIFLLAGTFLYPYAEQAATRLSDRQALLAAAAGLALLAVALVVVYPHANSHAPGVGSDRDDAANIGAHRLLSGEYPYGALTYLGNPISQLPGALVVAVPFYAAFGTSAYANVFWLGVLVALVALIGRSLPIGFAVVATTVVLSPGLVREYLTGGDLIANAVYVAVAAVGLLRLAPRRYAGPAAAVAIGLALASRANFALVLIPLAAALIARQGLRRAIGLLLVSVIATSSLVAVALAHPRGRDSLRVSDHLSALGRAGSASTVALAIGIAVLLAVRTRQWNDRAVLGEAAIVQALFPIALVINASAKTSSLDFSPLVSGYGVPALLLFLPCVAVGGPHLVGSRPEAPICRERSGPRLETQSHSSGRADTSNERRKTLEMPWARAHAVFPDAVPWSLIMQSGSAPATWRSFP